MSLSRGRENKRDLSISSVIFAFINVLFLKLQFGPATCKGEENFLQSTNNN